MNATPLRIGVDLGGTKIEGAVFSDDGQLHLRRRVPTPTTSYPEALAALVGVIQGLETELREQGKLGADQRCSVGVGHPGAIVPQTGLLENANQTVLMGHPVAADLEAALARPVRMANDANCFAVSESAPGGAAEGMPTVFGVILGTGVGGGLVVDGRPLTGVNAIAGEWGHNPLPRMRDDERPGPRCYCGRLGCIEAFLCGRGLLWDHARCGGAPFDSAKAIVEAGARGEPSALASLERYAERLARALASVINLFDPHAIVLGGGLSNCKLLYERIPSLWVGHVFSEDIATQLLPPAQGDSSGVRGAAWLW
ncbi:ROK family protein [Pseudenhygromyxa sp. WMMC2535]|uniref:ROK family protein n=1 Tax=Pseudenhygromyxa sp. WMMC2535 TaxID=2712867 RepID=UPI001552BCAB|nr:ROK family protein [Pseudenhygromyxa sp. WMMC2535]NVB37828.1 ROK family protein [Pseudenhygromyxa sp. WMMC2535]